MEIPRLGCCGYTTAMAAWDLSHICNYATARSPQPRAMSKARDQTLILMDTSWVLNLLSHNGNSPNFLNKQEEGKIWEESRQTVGSMLLAWSPMGQLGHFQALQNPQVRLAAPSRTWSVWTPRATPLNIFTFLLAFSKDFIMWTHLPYQSLLWKMKYVKMNKGLSKIFFPPKLLFQCN